MLFPPASLPVKWTRCGPSPTTVPLTLRARLFARCASRPERLICTRVDDEVAIVLHPEISARVSFCASGPQRTTPRTAIDHEIAVSLHGKHSAAAATCAAFHRCVLVGLLSSELPSSVNWSSHPLSVFHSLPIGKLQSVSLVGRNSGISRPKNPRRSITAAQCLAVDFLYGVVLCDAANSSAGAKPGPIGQGRATE